jgi:pectate lyase
MSKVLLLAAFLLLSATWVVAQQSSTAGSQNSQSGMSSGNESSIEGCLNGSAGNFTLISSTGITYQLTGASDDLAKHVNQQVRVRGTQSAATAPSNTSPTSSSSAPSPSGSSAASQPAFSVSKLSKIADTCSTSNK